MLVHNSLLEMLYFLIINNFQLLINWFIIFKFKNFNQILIIIQRKVLIFITFKTSFLKIHPLKSIFDQKKFINFLTILIL